MSNGIFGNTFAGLPVLVTGHTGFKGSWLSMWLNELGARVAGYSLPEPPTVPSHFEMCQLGDCVVDVRGDVRDLEALRGAIDAHRPAVIFHLAAQPLVLPAYDDPLETFDVNVRGTINLLEAVRTSDFVQAVVCITTEKVYEIQDWVWGYRENDRLGGHDPYGASKAMAELAIASYRRSYFADGPAVASARASNVVGGGDFADHRLVPDCMRALMAEEPIRLRTPQHVRPWQHVLEALSGYLSLAVQLLRYGNAFAEGWNFAPGEARGITARAVAEKAIELWGYGSWTPDGAVQAPKETTVLRLSGDKAASRLGWRPVYTVEETLRETVDWYRRYQQQGGRRDMYDVSEGQIRAYTERAQELGLAWAVGEYDAGTHD